MNLIKERICPDKESIERTNLSREKIESGKTLLRLYPVENDAGKLVWLLERHKMASIFDLDEINI